MKSLPILCALFVSFAGPEPCERMTREQKKLRGPWIVDRAHNDGEELPGEDLKALAMIFEGDTIRVQEGDTVNERFRFILHVDHKPRGIDFHYLEGHKKGRVDRAVYQLDGNTLKICVQENPLGERPRDFNACKGSQRSLVILKRKAE